MIGVFPLTAMGQSCSQNCCSDSKGQTKSLADEGTVKVDPAEANSAAKEAEYDMDNQFQRDEALGVNSPSYFDRELPELNALKGQNGSTGKRPAFKFKSGAVYTG